MKVYCEHYKTCKHDEGLHDGFWHKCKLIKGCDNSIVHFQDNGKPYCGYIMDYINLKTEFEVLVGKTIKQGELIEKNNT